MKMEMEMVSTIRWILFITVISVFIIISVFISPTSAISAGVSPSNITIDNATAGTTENFSFTIYNMGNDTTDYTANTKGNISEWISIDAKNVTVKGNGHESIGAKIEIPENIKAGTYKGIIIIKSIPSGKVTGNKVSVSVALPITININKTKKSSGFDIILLFIIVGIASSIQFLIYMRRRKNTNPHNKIQKASQQKCIKRAAIINTERKGLQLRKEPRRI